MAVLWAGPTGRLTTGHVLDVNKRAFERVIQDYDKQLYVKWNPAKLKGWGAWEIRRRPESKEVVDITEDGNTTYLHIGYREYDMIHHVLDCAFLNYDAVRKLKEMDVFTIGYAQWVAGRESAERKIKEEANAKARAESAYMAKQHRTEIKAFKDMVSSGFNPARLADVWEQS